jgi:thiol:disulfide interchange protein DsbC
MMRALLAVLAALMMGTVATPVLAQAKGAAGATEEQIRARMQELIGTRPDSVTRTPYGVFEVVVGTDVYYTDQSVSYVMVGRLIDTKTRQDVTQARRDELMKVDFAKLPLDQAVRLRTGSGARQFVTFEDPNCPYCRKLHNDIRSMKDVTVYVFLYPILSPSSFEKAKNIWCSKDRAAAWSAAMLENKSPPAAAADCKHPLKENIDLGQRLGVNGTPTLIFQDGSRLPGASSVDEIEKRLAAGKK